MTESNESDILLNIFHYIKVITAKYIYYSAIKCEYDDITHSVLTSMHGRIKKEITHTREPDPSQVHVVFGCRESGFIISCHSATCSKKAKCDSDAIPENHLILTLISKRCSDFMEHPLLGASVPILACRKCL